MFKRINIFIAVALVSTFFVSADAEESSELGPAVGTSIPHDLSVDERAGFSALTGEKGAALIFVRSVSWCPYCKRQIIDLDAARAEFLALGAELIYVSYDSPDKQKKFMVRKKLAGQFVSDPQSQIIDAFGIRNEKHKPGSFGHGIPHPVIFIVDTEGVILDKIYEVDFATNKKSYAARPQVEVVLSSVKGAFENADDLGEKSLGEEALLEIEEETGEIAEGMLDRTSSEEGE